MCSFYFMWAVLPFICFLFLFSTLGKLMNKLDLNLMTRMLQPRIRSCAEIPSDLMALDWDAAPAAAMLTSQETTEEHFHAALRMNDAEMRWNHLWRFLIKWFSVRAPLWELLGPKHIFLWIKSQKSADFQHRAGQRSSRWEHDVQT